VIEGWLSEIIKKHAGTFIGALLVITLSAGSYIFLHSVAKPYWISGTQTVIAGECLHTYAIINPGPWSTRKPKIELPLQQGAQIVDCSPGVNVEQKIAINRLWASMDEGLPPGCLFFVTYRHQYPTNSASEPVPAVMCDGKPCKNAPTFDLDLSLKLLVGAGALAVFGVVGISLLYLKALHQLASEKDSTTRSALETLLSKEAARATVDESERSFGEVESKLSNIKASPKSVKKKNNKAPNGNQSPSDRTN
jgi:hypothetical protein